VAHGEQLHCVTGRQRSADEKSLGVQAAHAYQAISAEMIITRGLTSD
jgi:hypothetical protein